MKKLVQIFIAIVGLGAMVIGLDLFFEFLPGHLLIRGLENPLFVSYGFVAIGCIMFAIAVPVTTKTTTK